MRYQDPKYNQNSKFVRNSTISVFNTSSDNCVFVRPYIEVDGADKINCKTSGQTCDYTGITYSQVYQDTQQCYSGLTTCPNSGMTWSIQIIEDDVSVYNEVFKITNSGNTITDTELRNEMVVAFTDLKYNYKLSGTTFNVMQPYGVENFKVNLDTDIRTNKCLSSLINWSEQCPPLVTNICDYTYSGITINDLNVYEITGQTNINMRINFSADTNAMVSTNTRFKYEIYQYNKGLNIFSQPALYKSKTYPWVTFSGNTFIDIDIPVNKLNIDGDYIIKGYYNYDSCTEFAKLLKIGHSTEEDKVGDKYKIYNSESDHHFMVFRSVDKPIITKASDDGDEKKGLSNLVMIGNEVDRETDIFILPNSPGDIVVTINGSVLTSGVDYTILPNVGGTPRIQLTTPALTGDTIGYIYNTESENAVGLSNDNFEVPNSIISGSTGNQGVNKVFYNTTTNKFEVYTSLTPMFGNDMILSINGAVLLKDVDYIQSTTELNRIILVGNLFPTDLISIYYNPTREVQSDIYSNKIGIEWVIQYPPKNENGRFIVELSTDELFTDIINTDTINYIIDVNEYATSIKLIGSQGDELYYRVKNIKKFINICGEPIIMTKYSDTEKITLRTNLNISY